MGAVLTEIITLMTTGLSSMATAIGGGLQSFATAIFLTGDGTTSDPYALSVYGALIVVFAGIALAINIGERVLAWVNTLGN